MRLATTVLLALAAGLILGIAISGSGNALLAAIPRYVEPIGGIWVNALRMTVIPLVVSAILIGINSLPDSRSVSRVGSRALLFFLLALGAAAMFAAVVGPIVLSHLTIDPGPAAALRASTASASREIVENARKIGGVGQWLTDLVPANPVKAAADGAILQLVTFSLLLGLAVTRIAASSREPLMRGVKGVYDAALVLVHWVLAAAPIGVFALTVPLASRLGIAAAGAVAYYVAAVSAMTLGFTVVFYLAAWLIGRQSPRVFARACVPAQAVALSSRSSLASLPALLEGAAGVLQLPFAIRSFVLPLGVATFRPAGAIAIPMAVLFMARLHGMELDAPQLATIALTGALTTFSAPGLPGGSILVMVPLLVSVGLPVGAVGLLIGVDTIPDMIRTFTNVTGDMATATVLARFERGRS